LGLGISQYRQAIVKEIFAIFKTAVTTYFTNQKNNQNGKITEEITAQIITSLDFFENIMNHPTLDFNIIWELLMKLFTTFNPYIQHICNEGSVSIIKNINDLEMKISDFLRQ
jgi:hypothetical protein